MYGIPLDGNVRLRTNDTVREFARLEYPAEDVLWVRATVRAAERAARRSRRFLRRPTRTHAPVACKGMPRSTRSEAQIPG